MKDLRQFTCTDSLIQNQMHGLIVSPNFPKYSPVSDCQITIIPPPSHYATFYILALDLSDYENSMYILKQRHIHTVI